MVYKIVLTYTTPHFIYLYNISPAMGANNDIDTMLQRANNRNNKMERGGNILTYTTPHFISYYKTKFGNFTKIWNLEKCVICKSHEMFAKYLKYYYYTSVSVYIVIAILIGKLSKQQVVDVNNNVKITYNNNLQHKFNFNIILDQNHEPFSFMDCVFFLLLNFYV